MPIPELAVGKLDPFSLHLLSYFFIQQIFIKYLFGCQLGWEYKDQVTVASFRKIVSWGDRHIKIRLQEDSIICAIKEKFYESREEGTTNCLEMAGVEMGLE